MTFQLGDYNVHNDDNFNGDESICVQAGEILSVTVNFSCLDIKLNFTDSR